PSFGVAINGSYLFEVAASPNGSWKSFNFFYTATTSSALLSLSSQINGTGVEYGIDNISVQAVPEPSSLILLCCGGIFLAANRLRRSKRIFS
ncbi:MAG: PEP-CTERM sorting domain-containing protein, partial [Limisphaerales bacterium]